MGARSGQRRRWIGLVVRAATVSAATVTAAGVAAAEPAYQRMARDLVGADQGVFVRAENGDVLAAVAADRPVHPASVSKVATTLALLAALGPDHRFTTRFLAAGPLRDGVLDGDLLVQGGGDPFLVSENALLVLAALRCLGVEEVEGGLRVWGDESLTFNWALDPAARQMAAHLQGTSAPAAWLAVAAAEPELLAGGPASQGIRFRRRPGAAAASARDPRLLLEHRSPPLRRILKELNAFSNNIFHPLADEAGGVAEVERRSRAAIPAALRDEVVIENAAGAGKTNRMSPRAAAALLDALAAELAKSDLDLADVLPVAGVDAGTLADRFDSAELRGTVVGKTGTFGSLGASALAGVARTRKHGVITFAILNRGVPVPEARRRQDAFVTALLRDVGAIAWRRTKEARPPFAEAEVAVATAPRCAFPRAAADRAVLRSGHAATPEG